MLCDLGLLLILNPDSLCGGVLHGVGKLNYEWTAPWLVHSNSCDSCDMALKDKFAGMWTVTPDCPVIEMNRDWEGVFRGGQPMGPRKPKNVGWDCQSEGEKAVREEVLMEFGGCSFMKLEWWAYVDASGKVASQRKGVRFLRKNGA